MRYLVAVGGNALEGRAHALDRLAKEIGRLHSRGAEIIVTHGNGPQVGELALHERLSLAELTAQTEAEIGIELEEAMRRRLGDDEYRIATVFTRVLVDKKDPAFKEPSKPIGPFYTKAQAGRVARSGVRISRLSGGYRRVVASPMPKRVLDAGLIGDLLSKGYIVIAGGGGGVAVTKEGNKLKYADAVIDKDYTSSLLATQLHADALLFFTKVDGIYLGFGKRGQRRLGRVKADTLNDYLGEGRFEKGSMAPKVRACIDFVKSTGKYAVVGNLSKPERIFAKKDVTLITRS